MIGEIIPTITQFFIELAYNKVFLAAFCAFALSQVVKVIALTVHEKRFSFGFLLRRAGMPSSHSATVAALTTAIYIKTGMSPLTVLSLIFAAVVVRDVLDVSIGMPQSQRHLNIKPYIHKPSEVAVGLAVGIIIPFFIF